MSRSRGATRLTTLPPIRSSPAEMSSSPAIMFSAVDLPQPDGPTRIMNSPSEISRLSSLTASKPSGYRLTTLSRTISAIVSSPLALDRPGGEARDDAALENQHHDQNRDGHDHRARGDRAGGRLELRRAREVRQRDRCGARRVARGQHVGEQEVVPGGDEREDPRGKNAGDGQRQDYPAERLHRRGPVHLRGLLQVPRDLP